jgi:hypothetical protein
MFNTSIDRFKLSIAMAICLASGGAAAQSSSAPGQSLWVFTMDASSKSLPEDSEPLSAKRCLTEKKAKSLIEIFSLMGAGDCAFVKEATSGDRTDFEMSCSATTTAGVLGVQWRGSVLFANDSIVGNLAAKIKTEDGDLEVGSRLTGARLGACQDLESPASKRP